MKKSLVMTSLTAAVLSVGLVSSEETGVTDISSIEKAESTDEKVKENSPKLVTALHQY